MRSSIPKVLHTVGGRTLVTTWSPPPSRWSPDHLVVVVGHGRDQVKAHLTEVAPKAAAAVQDEQHGTGHAVACALSGAAPARRHGRGHLRRRPAADHRDPGRALAEHAGQGNAVTVLTARWPTPPATAGSCARPTAPSRAIVEQKDATDAQRAIREINAGVYAFDAAALRHGLDRLGHRQRPGRAVPDRRARASRGPTGGRVGARASPTTCGRSRASTTGSSSPARRRAQRPYARASHAAGVDGASTPPPPGSTSTVDPRAATRVLEPERPAPRRHPRRDRRRSSARTATLIDTVVGAGATRHATRRPTAP